MSEGNKLPALSLEVKTLIDHTIKRYSVTLRASRFYYHTRGVHQDISNCTTAQESHSVHANTKRSLV